MKTLNLIYLTSFLVLETSCTPEPANIEAHISQRQIPVLTGKDANEVLKITVIRMDSIPVSINKIGITTSGTSDINDLESISIFYTGEKERFTSKTTFSNAMVPASELIFESEQKLEYD